MSLTEYNAAGQTIRSTSPGGVVTLNEYDARSRLVKTAVDMNRDGVIDSGDRVSETIQSVETIQPIEGSGTVGSVTVAKLNGVETSRSESADGGMFSRHSAFGRPPAVSATSLPGGGERSTATTNPDGSTASQKLLNGLAVLSTVKSDNDGADGSVETSYTHDQFGRVATVTAGDGGSDAKTTSYTYDDANRVTTTTDSAGRVATYGYDIMDRKTSETVVDSQGAAVSAKHHEYSPAGELLRSWGTGEYPVQYAYDSQGRMTSLTTYQNFDMDNASSWAGANPASPSVTSFSYDPLRGFNTGKTYADGNGPSFEYDADGRLTKRTWARGVYSTYTYDNAGQLESITHSDGTPSVSYTRDNDGRVTAITDAAGTWAVTYNDDGTTATLELTGDGGYNLSYGYDDLGRRTSMTINTAELGNPVEFQYGHDGFSRPSYSAQLDAAGESPIVKAEYSRHPVWGYITDTAVTGIGGTPVMSTVKTHDDLNRLTAISTTPADDSWTKSFQYQYNALNQRTQTSIGSGETRSHTYDPFGQLTRDERNAAANGGISQTRLYSYDAIGNRKTAGTDYPLIGPVNTSYAANELNQYTTINNPGTIPVVGHADPAADVAIILRNNDGKPAATSTSPLRDGNLFAVKLPAGNSDAPFSGSVEAAAALPDGSAADSITRQVSLPKAQADHTYDLDGNLTSDGTWQYAYDAENRLSSASSLSSPSSPPVKVEFTYDHQGRRSAKHAYTDSGAGWELDSAEHYAWDHYNLIAAFDGDTGNLLKSWTWGESGLISETDHAEGKTYLATADGNRNITAYIDASDGSIAAEYEYDPFGRIISKSGPKADDFTFRFASYQYDTETGLVYMVHRYYDPDTGRFPSRDPIGIAGGNNPYRYTKNDAINMWDWLGLAPDDWERVGKTKT